MNKLRIRIFCDTTENKTYKASRKPIFASIVKIIWFSEMGYNIIIEL